MAGHKASWAFQLPVMTQVEIHSMIAVQLTAPSMDTAVTSDN